MSGIAGLLLSGIGPWGQGVLGLCDVVEVSLVKDPVVWVWSTSRPSPGAQVPGVQIS